ncbi:hypothetical protein K3495_g2972 [Podosphaera aphanis]|nr:hypothetical protein K3495_g2972 [Podosphaera aphanis]
MSGVAERWMGITAVFARSMLYEAQLPHQLWDYAIEHAFFIKNRAPTSALPFSDTDAPKNTSYSAYYGKAADLRNLRVFGCKAYILYPPALNPQKWQPHTRNGNYVMVGMTSTKIWKLLDTLTLRDTVAADVEFDEYKFPSIDTSRFTIDDGPTDSGRRRQLPTKNQL